MGDLAIWEHTPEPVARIIFTRHDRDQVTYEWEGDTTWPVLATWAFERAAYTDWLERLPWKLVKVAVIPSRELSVYRRTDG